MIIKSRDDKKKMNPAQQVKAYLTWSRNRETLEKLCQHEEDCHETITHEPISSSGFAAASEMILNAKSALDAVSSSLDYLHASSHHQLHEQAASVLEAIKSSVFERYSSIALSPSVIDSEILGYQGIISPAVRDSAFCQIITLCDDYASLSLSGPTLLATLDPQRSLHEAIVSVSHSPKQLYIGLSELKFLGDAAVRDDILQRESQALSSDTYQQLLAEVAGIKNRELAVRSQLQENSYNPPLSSAEYGFVQAPAPFYHTLHTGLTQALDNWPSFIAKKYQLIHDISEITEHFGYISQSVPEVSIKYAAHLSSLTTFPFPGEGTIESTMESISGDGSENSVVGASAGGSENCLLISPLSAAYTQQYQALSGIISSRLPGFISVLLNNVTSLERQIAPRLAAAQPTPLDEAEFRLVHTCIKIGEHLEDSLPPALAEKIHTLNSQATALHHYFIMRQNESLHLSIIDYASRSLQNISEPLLLNMFSTLIGYDHRNFSLAPLSKRITPALLTVNPHLLDSSDKQIYGGLCDIIGGS